MLNDSISTRHWKLLLLWIILWCTGLTTNVSVSACKFTNVRVKIASDSPNSKYRCIGPYLALLWNFTVDIWQLWEPILSQLSPINTFALFLFTSVETQVLHLKSILNYSSICTQNAWASGLVTRVTFNVMGEDGRVWTCFWFNFYTVPRNCCFVAF